MKHVKLLLVSILLMVLMTGCRKVEIIDEMFEKQVYGVTFVALKLENEEDGRTYYKVFETDNRGILGGGGTYATELPIELYPWEFAYVTANFTEIIGGVDGGGYKEINEITECRKVSLEEAVELVGLSKISDFYKCETEYFEGCVIFGTHTKVNDFLIVGGLVNRYYHQDKKENSYFGDVTVYLQSEVIGHYNRLDFVGDYLVLYHHEGDENDLTLPENVTIEAIEELLATEKQYNDFMFVLHKREENTNYFYRKFLLGDRTLVDESQTDIPDFHAPYPSTQYLYTYFDLDGDGGDELVIWSEYPDNYLGVFHYEEGKITCWYSEADQNSIRYHLLLDGTLEKEYFEDSVTSHAYFRFHSDGSVEYISELNDEQQLILDKVQYVNEWFGW